MFPFFGLPPLLQKYLLSRSLDEKGSLHIGYWETYSFHFSCEGLAVELVAIISRRVGQSKLQEVKWPLNILIIAERQPLHKYYPFGSAMAPCFTNI